MGLAITIIVTLFWLWFFVFCAGLIFTIISGIIKFIDELMSVIFMGIRMVIFVPYKFAEWLYGLKTAKKFSGEVIPKLSEDELTRIKVQKKILRRKSYKFLLISFSCFFGYIFVFMLLEGEFTDQKNLPTTNSQLEISSGIQVNNEITAPVEDNLIELDNQLAELDKLPIPTRPSLTVKLVKWGLLGGNLEYEIAFENQSNNVISFFTGEIEIKDNLGNVLYSDIFNSGAISLIPGKQISDKGRVQLKPSVNQVTLLNHNITVNFTPANIVFVHGGG